jgi:hypothetical protein
MGLEAWIVLDGSGSRSQSQPAPAPIQRATSRARQLSALSPIAEQRYCCKIATQRKALQGPTRLRDSTTPTGQGSARQHTPQPLQGAPVAGLVAASGWIWMT